MVSDSGRMAKKRSLIQHTLQQMAQGGSVEFRELSILLLPVLSVEGIYQNRQIELVELPQDAIACMVAVRG
ncbi:hypothetical protein H6F53_23830 [Trichocoleus sp. FACHB-832]|uniref:hypothetical protein n=1 Tax=Trichocoleus sp. FACHB-832 TaxID=2692875 RepID=UPI0016846CE8|nr:hypothetical protein [Trichocoleus sp. FACHB-832]MBD1908480.1 hypothetical protein [Trichocoleus sp. FACHB-832]